jgi:pantoate--beta-alanine ligase
MTVALARTRAELASVRAGLSTPVALVPTMGALHEGHRMLLRRARELAGPGGSVIASVFVNPLQFRPDEDFDHYPRTLDDDLRACEQEGVAAVFAPAPREMYPQAPRVTVDPGPAGSVLEGEFRPGFFSGVLTVVMKLFQLVRPQIAVFGEKDAQQLALIRQMVADLDLGVRIAAVPIVRDTDGLALSSRNGYLSAAERAAALAIPAALAAGKGAAGGGQATVLEAARRVLAGQQTDGVPMTVDYLSLVRPDSFEPVTGSYAGPAMLAAAVRVGGTRLIDNVALTLPAARRAPGEGDGGPLTRPQD